MTTYDFFYEQYTSNVPLRNQSNEYDRNYNKYLELNGLMKTMFGGRRTQFTSIYIT